MTTNAKANEWTELLTTSGGQITAEAFVKNAKRKESAFHDDFEWNERRALRDYYMRRSETLIRHYGSIYNTEATETRLHEVRIQPTEKGPKRKVFKQVYQITDPTERAFVVARIWQRLRAVTKDAEGFDEFKDIVKFLRPRALSSDEVKEPTVDRKAVGQ